MELNYEQALSDPVDFQFDTSLTTSGVCHHGNEVRVVLTKNSHWRWGSIVDRDTGGFIPNIDYNTDTVTLKMGVSRGVVQAQKAWTHEADYNGSPSRMRLKYNLGTNTQSYVTTHTNTA